MDLVRIVRHLTTTGFKARRLLPPATQQALANAIAASEATHQGEIRIVVESALQTRDLLAGLSARDRAIDLFSALRIWDTEHNSGVLIYLLLADRTVEIIADRGIVAHAADDVWAAICQNMERYFADGVFGEGLLQGVAAVSALLVAHAPSSSPRFNELPDTVLLL